MSFHFMIVSHMLLILHKKYSFISLCLKPEMWKKVAKFKGAEYFRKALYIYSYYCMSLSELLISVCVCIHPVCILHRLPPPAAVSQCVPFTWLPPPAAVS